MKNILSILIITLFTLVSISNLFGQAIIINELYNGSQPTDEWIELLVVQDGLDIRGWDLRDFSSTGGAQAPLVLSNSSVWSNLKAGTVIIITQVSSHIEDLDPADFTLTIKTSNAVFFAGNPFNFAGTSEAIQIRNQAQTHIFGVSWGAGNATSIPEPKIHFSGASTSATSTAFKEDAVIKLTTLSNWAQNTTPTLGIGNTTANATWISTLRARAEGSGSVSITPPTLNGNTDTTITITYRRDPAFSVTNLRIIVNPDFNWSKNISSVNFNNMTATTSVSGDTIYFRNIVFNIDSTIININNITSAIFTGNYKFNTQSGAGNNYGDVAPIPVITVHGAAIPIADTKVNNANGVSLRLGDLVTVRGIVTVANQFNSPSYIQDNSAGMSVFGSSFSTNVTIGDEVIVTGRVAQFNGLNQIDMPTNLSVVSSVNHLEPILATPTQINNDGAGGFENFEGKLVRLNGVTVTEINGSTVTSWQSGTSGRNYRLRGISASDTVQIRIDESAGISGTVAPAGAFDVIGVVSQFKSTSPFIGGYQLMPRSLADIISSGPLLSEFPTETYIDSNKIRIEWKTINPGNSRIKYGKTTGYELGIIAPDNVLRTSHSVLVSGLSPATVYNMQAFSVNGGDTSFASNLIVSTSSASPTTGVINVYFNKTVNTSVSIGVNAQANVSFITKILDRINAARRSIDLALYSLSGTAGSTIASALVNAKNRGVKIRVIGEYDNRTTAPWSTLTSNGIPVIYDAYGANDGTGLHHNKFFVFDNRGGAPESVWVVTGSWNPTDPGTNDDRQNVIEIQDVALANAYTLELEEMWGSNTDVPNSSVSRFGSRKLNNTPHKFIIGGKHVESYFSPSDMTTSAIAKILGRAQGSVNVAMLTFTRKELADSIVSKKIAGKKTRVILDNNTDSGTQFPYLQTSGVDIRLKAGSGMLHHKYAIVDAEPYGLEGWIVTGSHNWSSSAETRNDENTIIIKDNIIANQYLQEFTARYYEAGGNDSIRVSVNETGSGIPENYSLSQNYPNPFNPTTNIDFSLPKSGMVTLKIYNMLGQEVATLINGEMKAGSYNIQFNGNQLSSGVYVYQIRAGSFIMNKKFTLLR